MTQLAALFAEIDRIAGQLASGELPDAIGACAAAQARLLARLTAPARAVSAPPVDELVDAGEMARRAALTEHRLRTEGRRWLKTGGQEGLPTVMRWRYMLFDPPAVLAAIRSGNRIGHPARLRNVNSNRDLEAPVSTGVQNPKARKREMEA